MKKKVPNVISEKRTYNNGVHTSKDPGKGSRRRHGAPEISQEKWDAIFGKKEKK
jgi:hypothetical protein